MDTTLYETCAKHDLSGIGVNVFGAPDRPYIGVYVHWKSDTGDTCASGTGETFDVAMACALAEMADRKRAALASHQMKEEADASR